MRTKLLLMLVAVAMFACGNVAMGDIVTRTIQDDLDDAEEFLNTASQHGWTTASYAQGNGWYDSSDLEVGDDGGDGLFWQVCAVQYDQLGIPKGALITSAKLTFQVDEAVNEYSSNDFTILAEAADNASTFSGSSGWLDLFEITDRARSAAAVGWNPAAAAVGEKVDTTDISTVIQEVVNHPGWSDNNRLTLMVYPDVYLALPDPTTGGSTTVTSHTYEAGPGTDSATLTVEFDPYPGKATLVAPYRWSYVDLALLEWERPDPNFPADDHVTVNVYFGTDPNLIKDVNGTVQIETNFDGDSTAGFPGHDLDIDTVYYWRVDCIDPNNGNPYTTEGYTWSFITTIPPAVTITESPPEVEGVSTNVSEHDRLANRDDYILTLSKDPVVPVTITVSEVLTYNPLTTTLECMEAYDGEAANAPQLQVTHSGGTAVSSRISSSLDDTEEWLPDNWNYGTSSDLEFFDDDGGQIIGLRFQNVDIEQGATIDSAIVEFEVDGTEDSGEVHGIITGENVDNAPAFIEEYNILQDRLAANPTSSVSFVWTEDYAVNTKVPTPDIASIIQEIVNRPGWNSGQSIVLFFTEDMNPDAADIEFIDATDPWAPRSSTYVLDSSNWETGVTVTIAAIDDLLIETDPELVTLAATTSSEDIAWNNVPVADVVVSILENDCGAWGYGPADFDGNCVTGLEDFAELALTWLNDYSLLAPVAK